MRMSKTPSRASVSSIKAALVQMISPLSARKTTTGSGVLSILFLLMESTPPVSVSTNCIMLRRRAWLWLR